MADLAVDNAASALIDQSLAEGLGSRAALVTPASRSGAQGDSDMKNVQMPVVGNILTITVDLTKEFGPSSSGKTIIVASRV